MRDMIVRKRLFPLITCNRGRALWRELRDAQAVLIMGPIARRRMTIGPTRIMIPEMGRKVDCSFGEDWRVGVAVYVNGPEGVNTGMRITIDPFEYYSLGKPELRRLSQDLDWLKLWQRKHK